MIAPNPSIKFIMKSFPPFIALVLLTFGLSVFCSMTVQAAENAPPGTSRLMASGRHVFGNKDIFISALDKAVDRSILQKNPRETNLWKALPYTCDECAGVMLGEGGGPDIKPATIRLEAKGQYRIYLGLYGAFACRKMRVRLSKDEKADTIPIKVDGDWEQRSTTICEIFWKEADLTGQDLILEGSGDGGEKSGALAYIRLDAIPERKAAYPLAITNDGYTVGTAKTPEEFVKKLDASVPEKTPLRIFLWGTGCADNCNFPTKVGQFYPNAGLKFGGRWKDWARNMGIWKKNGWDSLKLARDHARKRKWEFQVYIRMQAFRAPFPFDAQENSTFFNEHPQYHCRDKTGQSVNRLSYAYPEVQDYMVRLIKEIVDYDPDGVCLCFVRGLPLVLYEPIMVEGFKKQYGLDPRTLDQLDSRWIDYQCAVVTSFVRQAKKAMKPGQRLSVIVPGNELDCRRWGLDVAAWVKEGLIDDLMPAGQRFDAYDVHRDDPTNLDFRYFARLEGRENIRLIPVLYTWRKYHSDFAAWKQFMQSFLDQGADAYCVWDGHGASSLAKTKDIGTTMKNYKRPPPKSRKVKLRTLQGFRVDRYHYAEVI